MPPSQVLVCPLCLDRARDHEEQDRRYGIPRFDGYPPTSPEFLRMALIDACALFLIDRTKSLHGPFYERVERSRQNRGSQDLLLSGVILAAAAAVLFLRK